VTNLPVISEVIREIHKLGVKDIEGNMPPEEVLKLVEHLSCEERIALLLRLGEQHRFFFLHYQAECLSPSPNVLQQCVMGIATGLIGGAADVVQATIPGCANVTQSDHDAKAFHFRIKQILLGKMRGQLILPPGCEGGPAKEEG
jgi:hypothetical protein